MRFQILVDRRERPSKCTILPQAARPDFDILRFSADGRERLALTGDVLLHHEGESLADLPETERLAVRSISLIDCNWRRLPPLLSRVEAPLPRRVRIPAGFKTAYPRRNKDNLDPDGGLATIEALYIAAVACGHRDESLLEKYHFAREFLTANAAALEALACHRSGPSGV